jgi:hypothetical protein
MVPKPISEVNKIGFGNSKIRFCRTGRLWQTNETLIGKVSEQIQTAPATPTRQRYHAYTRLQLFDQHFKQNKKSPR